MASRRVSIALISWPCGAPFHYPVQADHRFTFPILHFTRMADSTARVHRNKSNRASAAKPADRKAVFKSVLSNPFEVQWYRICPVRCEIFAVHQPFALLFKGHRYRSISQTLSLLIQSSFSKGSRNTISAERLRAGKIRGNAERPQKGAEAAQEVLTISASA